MINTSYKVIATDLDWTLIYERTKINKDNLEYIHKFLKAGYIFIIVTGRPTFTSIELIKEFGFDKYENFYMSNYNGGSFYHPYSNKIIYNPLQISINDAQKINEITSLLNVNFMMYYDEKVYIDNIFDFKDKVNSIDNLPLIKIPINKIKKPLIKGMIAYDNYKLKEILPIFKNKFPHLDFFFSQRFYIEVLPLNVNKGTALDFISSYINIPLSKFIVLGDSENDIFMFKKVYLSFAMENSTNEVKKEASNILKLTSDSNFKYIIQKYFKL